MGTAIAHLDRPVNGGRRADSGGAAEEATLVLGHTVAARELAIVAAEGENPDQAVTLALENALLGARAPSRLVLAGLLSDQIDVLECVVSVAFGLVWILPTFPDPYAATLDASTVIRTAEAGGNEQRGELLMTTIWAGPGRLPVLSGALLPPSQPTSGPAVKIAIPGPVDTPNRDVAQRERGFGPREVAPFALLDLSTRVDLLGVATSPLAARLAQSEERAATVAAGADRGTPAPAFGVTGMSLALNGAVVATFGLPQVSWEPVESTAPPVPIVRDPAGDGPPLVISVPDEQHLVPFAPGPVLAGNIANVAAGLPFAALFSLPFGLTAMIVEPQSGGFVARGGRFASNRPKFKSVGGGPLTGGEALTLRPPRPAVGQAGFAGATLVDGAGNKDAYGPQVLGFGVSEIFNGQFGPAGVAPGVPLRRIDLSGYGASIFSEWVDNTESAAPGVNKVHFEASLGRTAFEVIQVHSILYPYAIRVVRTVTMQRQNAGWVKRTDSGWQAASAGIFDVPAYTGRVHLGAFAGAFNVRNIRDRDNVVGTGFEFQEVRFDADLGVAKSLNVLGGGFAGATGGPSQAEFLVASRDILGYVQIAPDLPADADAVEALISGYGPFAPSISCTVEVGAFDGHPGTVVRCSAFEVAAITRGAPGSLTPSFGVALRGAPQIPRGGGWSMGLRRSAEPAPTALAGDFPVPLVQPAGTGDFWHVADVADLLDLAHPHAHYSLLHATGTHKVLFESPQIPTSAGVDPPPSGAGLQFRKPAPQSGGSAPVNAGSPNLGDLASILNSTGLFPDIAAAISLMEGSVEQIKSVAAGFEYSKTHEFDPSEEGVIFNAGLKIALRYADTTAPSGPVPAELVYSVNSAAQPSWTLSLKTLSFLVTVPTFGSDPLLTITGGFYADEHTKPGLTNLDVQLGGALEVLKGVFSKIQALAQFLPGGVGANLDVALSDGRLTVRDTFTIGRLPLGLGDLTDVSLDLGMAVSLAPLSVDFLVGIGAPDNPFNWIVTPLAGNGLMNLGVRGVAPRLVIQGGIGLGVAIDLGIAVGSASVTIAIELDVNPPTVKLMAILTGQATLDVLDGLATSTFTMSAGLGFSVDPMPPNVKLLTDGSGVPDGVQLGPETVTLIATCSVGIHITVCWLVSVGWDGWWTFSQSVTTPQVTVGI